MSVTVYAVMREMTSPRFAKAFARGCGGKLVTDDRHVKGDIAMFGSPHIWHVLNRAQAEGRNWIYGDHAYFRRFRFYRVTRNAYQHRGDGETSGVRLRNLGVEIEPWKKGRGVLVCPPDRAYAERHGFDASRWTRDVIDSIARHTDRPITIRAREGAERNPVTLRAALDGCHAMVTHHSNAAVEALCMGYPVFVTGECAARSMAETDLSKIETPRYPDDRNRWAAVLADNQWTMNEMRQGLAWRKLNEVR